MSRFQSFVCRCLFLITLFIACGSAVSAQSTIFNVPSTDVLPEKLFFVEADFIAHFDAYRNGGFQTYGYRTVYGVRKKLEVGINFFYTRNGVTSPKELQANLKWKAYENEKYGFAVTTGSQLFVPLNKSAGKRVYTMLYTNASKVVKHTRGLRLTGGVYTILGEKREFGTKTGGIIGIEQPVKGRLSFIADWYSGKNRFGYSALGLNYAITKKQFLMLGYNFGNSGRGNNAFSAFYGLTY